MRRSSCVLALLIAWLAIGCGSPTREVISFEMADAALLGDASAVAPDTMEDDDGTIMIVPSDITISGTSGQLSTEPFMIVGSAPSTHVATMQWLNDAAMAFTSVDPTCPSGGAICPFGTSHPLPKTGTLGCTPNDAAARTATLRVTSNTGVVATALVTCQVTAAGASFTVPSSVGRISANVDETTMTSLVVSNTGSEDLMITVAIDASAHSSKWQPLQCTTNACPLMAGDTLSIDLSFTPTEHGDLDATIQVFGPPVVGSQSVALLGTGLGGKLRVDEPADPFVLDFGTIAKNQLVTLPVKISNIGNASLEVTPDVPGNPFTVATVPVSIGEGQQGELDVSCQSTMAQLQQTRTMTLTTDAYDQNTQAIELRCAIANTSVQVTNPLDFGELRVGETDNTLPLVVLNPVGSAPVQIKRIELVNAPDELELVGLPQLPTTLAANASLAGMLVLATEANLVLEDVTLEVEVTESGNDVTLELPVTGRVGTPAAVVLPPTLALGTVCVGTPVDGEVTMVNTGSVTLRVQRPAMDSTSFVPLFTNPTDYPMSGAPLLPGDKATVGLMPASALPGIQQGTLVWLVDAPNSPFMVPVSLELLMEGTAVSPARLIYGAAAITDPPTANQTITLENCGPDPATVSYGAVTARSGGASAWLVEPDAQTRELLRGEKLRIRVAFSPSEPGRHEADLRFEVGGTTRVVALEGDAIGELPEETSFYACGCGSSEPQRGWPILLALLVVLRAGSRPSARVRRRTC